MQSQGNEPYPYSSPLPLEHEFSCKVFHLLVGEQYFSDPVAYPSRYRSNAYEAGYRRMASRRAEFGARLTSQAISLPNFLVMQDSSQLSTSAYTIPWQPIR